MHWRWWPPGFWDALLVTIWLAFAALVLLLGASSVVAPRFAWSEAVVPLASCAFVSLSVARFMALRTRSWALYLGVGQLVSIVIQELDARVASSATRHWVMGVVEHWLAGSAAAFVLFMGSLLWTRFCRRKRDRTEVGDNALTRALLLQRRQSAAAAAPQ